MNNHSTFITKYKPYFIDDFTNNHQLINTIKTLIELDSLNILLVGNVSSGKTTLLNCIAREYYGLQQHSNLPENNTLQHATKLAIVEDKPIMLDYWSASLEKTVLIGVKENEEKLLVKSEEEYTSPISKIYKIGKEYIIITENSIYLVDIEIPTKRISA